MASRAGERALSRTSGGGAGCDGAVAVVEIPSPGAKAHRVYPIKGNVSAIEGGRAKNPAMRSTPAFSQDASAAASLGVATR